MRVEIDYPAVLVLQPGAVSWSGYDSRLEDTGTASVTKALPSPKEEVLLQKGEKALFSKKIIEEDFKTSH